MSEFYPPQMRWMPNFEERTSTGIRVTNPVAKLFDERIIYFGGPIVDETADNALMQLIYLESADPDRDITMYINSPGGDPYALMAIYDTMQYVRPDIQTVCLGQAASAAAILLAAGTKGKRLAVPNARVLIHQPRTMGGFYGQVSDIDIQAAEISRVRRHLDEVLALHTGQSPEQIRTDTERDKILMAEEARQYGIIDEVVQSRKLSAVR